jgi:hypothetical protein
MDSENTKEECLCATDWTAQISLNGNANFDFWRTRPKAAKAEAGREYFD